MHRSLLPIVAGAAMGVSLVVSLGHQESSRATQRAVTSASAPSRSTTVRALDVATPSQEATNGDTSGPATSTYTIDLSTVEGYSTSDVGPALQSAIAQLLAPGMAGGSILIPPVNHTIVTPVTAMFFDGQRIRIFGVPGQSVLIPNTGPSTDAITISHAISQGVGTIVSLEDLIFLGVSPQAYSCRHVIYIDNSAESSARVRNLDFIGVYADNSLMRLEDGSALVENVQYYGVDTNPANMAGLLQLWQVYLATVRELSQRDAMSFQGQYWSSGGVYSLIEWEAPQLNANPNLPNGGLSIDGVSTEMQCIFPVLINPTGTFRGGRVSLRHGKLTVGGLAGWSAIVADNIDYLTVENMSFNNGAVDVSQYAVQLSNVGATSIRGVWGDTQFASANLISADAACGSLEIADSNLGATPRMAAGVSSQAGATTLRSRGVTASLATADGAITPNTLVKPALVPPGGVSALLTSDPVSMAIGVALDVAQNPGDQIRVATLHGQIVSIRSDGAGAINPGDPLTVSSQSAGRATAATSGSIIGRALSAAPSTADALVTVIWSKEPL